jgi:hypothetical protein
MTFFQVMGDSSNDPFRSLNDQLRRRIAQETGDEPRTWVLAIFVLAGVIWIGSFLFRLPEPLNYVALLGLAFVFNWCGENPK